MSQFFKERSGKNKKKKKKKASWMRGKDPHSTPTKVDTCEDPIQHDFLAKFDQFQRNNFDSKSIKNTSFSKKDI